MASPRSSDPQLRPEFIDARDEFVRRAVVLEYLIGPCQPFASMGLAAHPPSNILLIEPPVDGTADASIGCSVDEYGCPIARNLENEWNLDDKVAGIPCDRGDSRDNRRMCHRFELAELDAAPEDNPSECPSIDAGIGPHTRPALAHTLVRLSSRVDDRVAEPVGIYDNSTERSESVSGERLAASDAAAEEDPHRLPRVSRCAHHKTVPLHRA